MSHDHTIDSNHHQELTPELSCVRDFLLHCIPFDELPAYELDRIILHLSITYHRKGTVFNQDNTDGGLRILRSGAAELRTPDETLLERIGETLSFNLLGLNQEQPGVRAILIEDSLVYCLPESAYQDLRKRYRYFDRFFSSQRSRRVRRAARHEPNPHNMMRSVKDIMSHHVHSVSPDQSIQSTAQLMDEHRISSMLVIENHCLQGIVTDRDIRSRAVATGLDLQTPVSHIMTLQPKTIDPTATLFDATLFMTKHHLHHLPVVETVDPNNIQNVKGVITASDLMLAREDDPVFLVQHISRQTTLAGLKEIVSSLPNLLLQWVHAGIRAPQVSHTLTAISDAITIRLIELAEDQLGPPPVPYCWLGFGSQGRAEQLLGADQDNGLIISNDVAEADLGWYEKLAQSVSDGLNECGYAYCNGKIMATTEEWRQPLAVWQKTVDSWTQSPTNDAVMRVSIFFDLRAIHGDAALCQQLQQHMLSKSSNSIFLAALAQNTLSNQPPLGIFRRFVVEQNGEHEDELDLKKRGVIPIVDMVRLHALANKIDKVNTLDRIDALAKCKAFTIEDSRNLQDAFRVIMQARVRNQADQISTGASPNNHLHPDNMGKLLRNQLKDAFSIVKDAQQIIKLHYRQGLN